MQMVYIHTSIELCIYIEKVWIILNTFHTETSVVINSPFITID